LKKATAGKATGIIRAEMESDNPTISDTNPIVTGTTKNNKLL